MLGRGEGKTIGIICQLSCKYRQHLSSEIEALIELSALNNNKMFIHPFLN